MEEDEEVVFEGSAIYKHLQDTGYTDFEPIQLRTSYCQEDTTENDSCESEKEVLDWLREKWLCLRSTVLGKWAPEYVAYKEIAEYVVQSKLVNDDDWLVLEHFMLDGEELHHSGFLTGPKASVYKIFFSFSISLVILLVLQLLCVASETWCIYIVTFFLTLPMSLILGQIAAFVRYIILIHRVKKFVLLLKEISQIASKSIRLLLEVDLITKGFVLAQGSSLNSFCESGESPQCSNLSSALCSSLNSLARILHLNHRYLEKCSPQYCCMRQLFDKVEMPAAEEAVSNTELIIFLKKWVTITKLQLSTVLTELLLCIQEPVMLDRLCATCSELFTCSEISVLRRETTSLTKHLEYTKSFWLHDRQEEIKPISLEEKKKNVYIAIHSLSLHMQAALFRLQALENTFESENISKDYSQDLESKKCEDFPSYVYVKKQLNAIKTELDSCQGCMEEAALRVDRKYGVNNNEINPALEHLDASDIQEKNTSSEVAKNTSIVLYDMEEPVIEDEVFEAFIDQEYCDRQREGLDDDFWNTDIRKERKKLRQQKEQGKQVLNELQPLLIKRRKMWEERASVALNRQLAKQVQGVDVDSPQTIEQKHWKPNFKREQEPENLVKDIYDDNICEQVEMEVQEKNILSFGNVTKNFSDSSAMKNLSTCESLQEEEVDSDDERLEVYRKLKQELDEDEKSRLQEDAEKERKFHEEGECIFSLPMKLPHEIALDTRNHFEPIYDCEIQHHQQNDAEHTNRISNKDANPLSSLKSSVVKCDTAYLSKEEVGVSVRDEYDRVSDSENILSVSKLDKEVQILKEEVFVHNEEADEDESPHIDWNITLPVRRTETLADRMQLFSAGQNIGFQANIAAEAQAASRKFWMTASGSTEIFGGVGDGEEIFGSDDEEEDEQ